MDVWPSFWTKLRELINSGNVFSCVSVKQEIEKGGDELTAWLKKYAPKNFYCPETGTVMEKYAETQMWVANNPVFTESARYDFANVADAYLVATAAAENMTLVTYETPNPMCKSRVKIPDVCLALGVRFCDLNTALRELKCTI